MLGDFRLSALVVRLDLYLVRGATRLLGIGVCLPVAQPQQWLVATCNRDRSPAAHHRRRLRNANVSDAHQFMSGWSLNGIYVVGRRSSGHSGVAIHASNPLRRHPITRQ